MHFTLKATYENLFISLASSTVIFVTKVMLRCCVKLSIGIKLIFPCGLLFSQNTISEDKKKKKVIIFYYWHSKSTNLKVLNLCTSS